MSADDLDDYGEFKADILRAYELQPEAYRLQFRGKRKRASDSYLSSVLVHWSKCLRGGLQARVLTLSRL
ncbi:hypothetical protein E2C01_082581 [Portunus trituberculatus]|uniref:Uncharacterized protein n=1 Tax=Portunus trituberculatus TaxID=210409 RepID=A0A5B7IZI1_PORTR|nr:hypothetical protein [Portunus trituberculatus]